MCDINAFYHCEDVNFISGSFFVKKEIASASHFHMNIYDKELYI